MLWGTGIFIGINLITFLVRGVDKWKAQHKRRRISERTLLMLSLF